jgi:protein virilizer
MRIYSLTVAPRGRGFSRAATIRGDIFRSRPPNTSRPPSLHVDDFLAMESGQPSYNKREIISSSRGRGRGSGFISRGGRGLSSYRLDFFRVITCDSNN